MIEQLNLQEGTDHLEQEAAVATEDAAPAVTNSELGLALAATGAWASNSWSTLDALATKVSKRLRTESGQTQRT